MNKKEEEIQKLRNYYLETLCIEGQRLEEKIAFNPDIPKASVPCKSAIELGYWSFVMGTTQITAKILADNI